MKILALPRAAAALACGSVSAWRRSLVSLLTLAVFSVSAPAQETVGGGSISNPAVGPAASYGIGGPNAVLVKNWNFGTNGTIRTLSDLNAEFYYHDQFNTFSNGANYGAKIVAPDAANALSGQPIEGVNSPTVRQFFPDTLRTYLTALNGATTVVAQNQNAGCGSFMAKWKLPNGGALLGQDIIWETRVRLVMPPYFWFALWTSGNFWAQGAEHDVVESFGFDDGAGHTNFDGRYWHSNTVNGSDAVDYDSGGWAEGMAASGIASFDATQWHTWTWWYRADNTYHMYVDGIEVQHGTAPYAWTVGAAPGGTPVDLDFLFDASWGHTAVASVNKSLPASALVGKYYEWDYSRVYLVPPTSPPPEPTGVAARPADAEITISWQLTNWAMSYNIYRGTSPGGEGATPLKTGITALSFTDTALQNGVTYYYKVAAVNSLGTSPLSGETSAVPRLTFIVDDVGNACDYSPLLIDWTSSTSAFGYYGSGYHHDGNTGGGKSVAFIPTLPRTGNYEVFFRAPGAGNRANNVPVDVHYAGGVATVPVNERINSNAWVSLGTYPFAAGSSGDVTIRNDGANGYVMVDALEWVPTFPLNLQSVTVDNTQATTSGTWTTSTYASGFYHRDYLTKAAGSGSATVRWTPNLGAAGNYAVYYRLPDGASDRTATAHFTVVYAGGSKSYVVDETAPGATWVLLGLHPFAAGSTGYVQLSDSSPGGKNVIADAIRFIQLPDSSAVPDAPSAPTIVAALDRQQIGLSWRAPAGALTYRVKRATTSGGPYSTLATGLVDTSYNDAVVTAGVTYYYVVSAENSLGEGANSAEVATKPAVIVDNADGLPAVDISAGWTASAYTPGYFGSNYLQDGNTGATGGKYVRFTPTLPVDGIYDLYLRWIDGSNRANNAPLTITSNSGTHAISLNQRSNGQRWTKVDSTGFVIGANGNILLSNDGANGYVVADAAQFVYRVFPATVTLGGLASTYDGNAKPVSVTTNPADLDVIVTYNGSTTPPTETGDYAVLARVDFPSFTGSASGTLTIAPAPASVLLGDLSVSYDGTPKAVSVTTSPAGLAVAVTYDGAATPPVAPGTYTAVATVSDPHYTGSASGTLTIACGTPNAAAPVRRGRPIHFQPSSRGRVAPDEPH